MTYTLNMDVFRQFPKMESKRLQYVNFALNDAEALHAIRSNEQVMRYMGIEAMKSVSDAETFIEAIGKSFAERKGINWKIVYRETGHFLGYFGFWRIDAVHRRAEMGYALHPDYWGQGFMRETMHTMIRFGFDTLYLHSIEANVDPDNASSIRLLEKEGFVKEAHFKENHYFNGIFYDSAIYSLLKSNHKR